MMPTPHNKRKSPPAPRNKNILSHLPKIVDVEEPAKPPAQDTETSTTAGSDVGEDNAPPAAADPAEESAPDPDQPPAEAQQESSGGGIGMTLRDTSAKFSSSSGADPSGAGGGPNEAAPSAFQTPFEASLLLGISATPDKGRDREASDPSTLPTSYTSFLDMLSDEQKRTRHRFIPGVDGFRKLYRSEVKADLVEARRIKRRVSPAPEEDEEMDDEDNIDDGDEASGKEETTKRRKVRKADNVPSRSAFLAPTDEERQLARSGQLAALLTSTDFERGQGSPGLAALTSPRVTTSLTSYNPPRPQESTPAKTRSRLRRWEACPSEIETDLVTFRKTVDRTREELGKAQTEREKIEGAAAAVRGHLRRHLEMHADEAAALNDEVRRVHGRIVELDGKISEKVSGEGAEKGRKVEDVLASLSKLVETGNEAKSAEDWRAMGVGGVGSDGGAGLASGWALAGDEVVVIGSGLEGTVVGVDGPGKGGDVKAAEAKAADDKKEDAMEVDKPGSPAKADDKKDEYVPPSVGVRVKLATTSEVKTYRPSELRFKSKPTLSASSIKQRWAAMAAAARSSGIVHDTAAMDSLINAEIGEDRRARLLAAAAPAEDDDDEGKKSPVPSGKSSPVPGFTGPRAAVTVPEYAERSVLPFGAGLIEAPAEVRDYAAVMPLERLEREVRRAIYGTTKPRVSLFPFGFMNQTFCFSPNLTTLQPPTFRTYRRCRRPTSRTSPTARPSTPSAVASYSSATSSDGRSASVRRTSGASSPARSGRASSRVPSSRWSATSGRSGRGWRASWSSSGSVGRTRRTKGRRPGRRRRARPPRPKEEWKRDRFRI